MKKSLLSLLVMLAIAGTTMAQDIWSCGSHSNNGKIGVGIYLNGVRVTTLQHDSYNFSAYDITRWGGAYLYGLSEYNCR